MESIPNHLFDLLNEKDFEELTPEEQSDVLAYMDKQTYTSMHIAALAAKSFFKEEPVMVNPNQLHHLLKKVEVKQYKTPTIVWNKPIALWKAAAIFLLLGGGWLIHTLATKNLTPQTTFITQLDTVFVEKEIPGETIHDTVYIEYERKQQRTKKHHELPIEYSSLPIQEVNIPAMSDVNIVGVQEKDKPANTIKGNSIKDDSLINAFGFVTL